MRAHETPRRKLLQSGPLMVAATPLPPEAPVGPLRGAGARWELARILARLVLGLAAFFGAIALAARLFRDDLDALGFAFVARFGHAGMFAGVYLADAFTFPIPPQFYLLTAITGGGSQVQAIAVVSAASVLAGATGYRLAGLLSRVRLFAAHIDAARPTIDRLIGRYGTWAIVVAGLMPIPFSILCYLWGLYRLPRRYFAVHLLLRVPRLFVYYALLRLGWAQGG